MASASELERICDTLFLARLTKASDSSGGNRQNYQRHFVVSWIVSSRPALRRTRRQTKMEKRQSARRWQAVSVQLQVKIFELMMINKMSELAHYSSIVSCFSQQLHKSPANIVHRVQFDTDHSALGER